MSNPHPLRGEAWFRAHPGVVPDSPKTRAHKLVYAAVKSGTLPTQPCEECGSSRVDAHHRYGYDRPLDVAWLCRLHHYIEHRGYSPNRLIVARMVEEGYTQAEIARHLGVGRTSVWSMLRRMAQRV